MFLRGTPLEEQKGFRDGSDVKGQGQGKKGV